MRRLGGSLLTLIVLGVASLVAQSGSGARRPARPYTTWTAYQGGAHSAQYSALDQIDRSNVARLQVAWTYPVTGTTTFNPIVIDEVLYTRGSGNALVALNAATGEEIWSHANQGAIGARGLNYWESADRSDRRLIYLNAGFLTAVDARTGRTIASYLSHLRNHRQRLLDNERFNRILNTNLTRILHDNLHFKNTQRDCQINPSHPIAP